MLDRTDLLLMLYEQIFEAPIEGLMELYTRFTGAELELVDEGTETIAGDVKTLCLDHPESLKMLLEFMVNAFDERLLGSRQVMDCGGA